MTYALVYLLVFFFAFGTIGNFGILARQRSQAMPFVFVILALPAVLPKRGAADASSKESSPKR
jgi:hypothetical protein